MTLRVILQIVPFGDESQVREIGRLNISNVSWREGLSLATNIDGSHDDRYLIEVNDYNNHTKETPRIYHNRKHGVWELVRKAMNELKL